MKKFFFDLETTGVDPHKHSIHQISALIEIDGEVVKELNYSVHPHPKAHYDKAALEVCKKTEEEIRTYPPMEEIHKKLTNVLARYVNKFDKTDKFHLVGYNNRYFDDRLFRVWFEHCQNKFFGSFFWSDSLDALVLISQYLLERRAGMSNFKLHTVCKELGIEVDDSRLHDALYDVHLTREVYMIAAGLEIEIK